MKSKAFKVRGQIWIIPSALADHPDVIEVARKLSRFTNAGSTEQDLSAADMAALNKLIGNEDFFRI